MTDPLSMLRDYTMNNKEIIEKNNEFIFGEYSWPKTSETNYLVSGSGKKEEPKQYYTLECLHFLLKNSNLFHPLYVDKAKEANVPYVRRPDRKKLLAYLHGESNTSENIDKDNSVGIQVAEIYNAPEKQNQHNKVPVTKKLKAKPYDYSQKVEGHGRIESHGGRGRGDIGSHPSYGGSHGGYGSHPRYDGSQGSYESCPSYGDSQGGYGSHPSYDGSQGGYESCPSYGGSQGGSGSHPSYDGFQGGYVSYPSYGGSQGSYGSHPSYDGSQRSFYGGSQGGYGSHPSYGSSHGSYGGNISGNNSGNGEGYDSKRY